MRWAIMKQTVISFTLQSNIHLLSDEATHFQEFVLLTLIISSKNKFFQKTCSTLFIANFFLRQFFLSTAMAKDRTAPISNLFLSCKGYFFLCHSQFIKWTLVCVLQKKIVCLLCFLNRYHISIRLKPFLTQLIAGVKTEFLILITLFRLCVVGCMRRKSVLLSKPVFQSKPVFNARA